MYTKKEKGNIGLAKAMAELTVQKIHVSIPIEEDLKYDLVVEKEGVCKRMQVRYCTPSESVLAVKLKSVWSDKKGNHVVVRQKGDFDILAVYCPSNDEVYFVDDKGFENTTVIYLRLFKSKNNHKVRMAKDYLDCGKLFKE
jgi:hypothetical protein